MSTAAEYRIEHVAEAPPGYHVRTFAPGPRSDHLVRVAFPKGARRRGSGQLVEILHPPGENPCRFNPESHRIVWLDEMVRRLERDYRGWRKAGMSEGEALERTLASSTAGPAAIAELKRRIGVQASKRRDNPTFVFSVANGPRIERGFATKREARAFAKQLAWDSGHSVRMLDEKNRPTSVLPPVHAPRRRNPEDGELADAERLYETFHGRQPREILEMQESAEIRGEYTALGPPVVLVFVAPNGNEVKIKFRDSDEVKVASSPDGKQIYFIGGNQDISEHLELFTADTKKDFIDLGDAVFLSYDASKWQTGYTPVIWEHKLGEESGIRPRGFFDNLRKRIYFAGGNYRVERPGIVD